MWNCKDPKYSYQPAGHIITGNIKNITDLRIRSINKGLNTGFLHRYTSTNVAKKLLVPDKNFVIEGTGESMSNQRLHLTYVER